MDCIVHGILQVRIPEWVVFPFSREYSQPRSLALQADSLPAEPQFSLVQSFSHIQLFVTPWTAACQASLSITNSRSPLKPMSIVLVMPSSHLILSHLLLLLPSIFPSIRVFSNELSSGGQNIGISPSTSVLPMNTQDWSPLGWTGWSPCSPRDSQEFSNTTVRKHLFFGA